MTRRSPSSAPFARQRVWIASATVFWTVLAIAAEFSTPTDYVLGYLYVLPVGLVGGYGRPRTTAIVTLGAIGLVLLNLWIPAGVMGSPAAITNRLLVGLALLVTALLSDRARRDRTRLAQQQAQLAAQSQLAQLREDFAATLTHDLKTPLLGAIATLEAFQAQQLGPTSEPQQQVLAVMLRSHRNSLRLLESVLEIYRNDAEGVLLDRQPWELGELAERAIAPLRVLAAGRRVTIRLERGDSGFWASFWVAADALQLERAIDNLLLNALNHAPRDSQILVQLRSLGSCHRLEVSDSGPGIPLAALPKLFDRFYQAGSDRQLTGSGLGLYLSRQIIEAHGGRIWAENRSPQGATFLVELAACPPPIAPQAHANSVD